MTSEPSKVFISHRNCEPDKTLAHQLSEALMRQGHQPFLDFSNIQFGEKWPERIDQELKCCDCLLLLLSRQAITSDWVTQEFETIWKRRHQGASQDYPMILPVLIQPASDSMFSLEDAPYELRSYLSKVQYQVWRSHLDSSSGGGASGDCGDRLDCSSSSKCLCHRIVAVGRYRRCSTPH